MESNQLPQRRQLRREQAALHLAGSGRFRGTWTAARRRGRAEAARDAGDRGNPGTRSGSGQARADLRGNFSLRQIAERVFFTFHRAPLARVFHLSPRSAVALFSPFTALRCRAFFTFHRAPLSRFFHLSPRSAVALFSPFTALRRRAFFTFHRAPPSRFFHLSPRSVVALIRSEALNLFFRRRLSLEDVNLAGKILEVDFRRLEDTRGLAPVTDYYQQLDYLARAQMLLQPIERRAAGLNVGVHLAGELQDQAFQFAEAFGVLPILDRGDLLFRDSDVPGRGDVLRPFVNGMAILGGSQNRNFSEFRIERGLREKSIA